MIVRQIEMLNVLIGYEQANRYSILCPSTGLTLAYLVEEPSGVILRQLLGTHRSLQATILSLNGEALLHLRRPFSFLTSRMLIETDQEQIGEVVQDFHLWRRQYALFVRPDHPHHSKSEMSFDQFGALDAGFLAWEFEVYDQAGHLLAHLSRHFTGLGREVMTDTGQYLIRFEINQVDRRSRNSPASRPLTTRSLHQRAVLLAAAVSM